MMMNFDAIVPLAQRIKDMNTKIGHALTYDPFEKPIYDLFKFKFWFDKIGEIASYATQFLNIFYIAAGLFLFFIISNMFIRLLQFCFSSNEYKSAKHFFQAIGSGNHFNGSIRKNRFLKTKNRVDKIDKLLSSNEKLKVNEESQLFQNSLFLPDYHKFEV